MGICINKCAEVCISRQKNEHNIIKMNNIQKKKTEYKNPDIRVTEYTKDMTVSELSAFDFKNHILEARIINTLSCNKAVILFECSNSFVKYDFIMHGYMPRNDINSNDEFEQIRARIANDAFRFCLLQKNVEVKIISNDNNVLTGIVYKNKFNMNNWMINCYTGYGIKKE